MRLFLAFMLFFTSFLADAAARPARGQAYELSQGRTVSRTLTVARKLLRHRLHQKFKLRFFSRSRRIISRPAPGTHDSLHRFSLNTFILVPQFLSLHTLPLPPPVTGV